MGNRNKPLIKWVYITYACDYEACWPLYVFDSELKARQYCDRYVLKAGEQEKGMYRKRVF